MDSRPRRAIPRSSTGRIRRSRASPTGSASRRRPRRNTHETRALMRELKLNTVCEEAACPNIGECWKQKHATVMILGSVCTRACAFCNVATGRPDRLDPHEPAHVGRGGGASSASPISSSPRSIATISRMAAAAHFAETIRAIRAAAPAHHDRGADARFPAQARRDRDRGRGAARCLQPQSRDRAAALSRGAAGRALFRLAAAARPGQGARPGDVHQIRPDGRARREHGTRCCR